MKSGNSWSYPDTISKDTQGAAGDISAVADTTGKVHVVWDQNFGSRTYTNVYYRCYKNNKWSSQIRLNCLPGAMNPDITIDRQQQLHIVWQQVINDSTSGTLVSHCDIYYKKLNGMDWSDEKNITNFPLGDACCPKIAVDGRGYIYVAWEEIGVTGLGGPDYSCWFSFSDGDDWAQPQVIQNGLGRYPRIAVNQVGMGCVIWSWSNVMTKFFINTKFTTADVMDHGLGWKILIDDNDTAFVIYSAREIDSVHNSGEIYYSKSALPDFSENGLANYMYMTFSGKANIVYELPTGGMATFELYDSIGRLVRKTDLGYRPKGKQIYKTCFTKFIWGSKRCLLLSHFYKKLQNTGENCPHKIGGCNEAFYYIYDCGTCWLYWFKI